MTVSELLSRVSSRELTEWMAFYELEPFGWEAGLLGHAITSSTVMNSRRSKKSDKVFVPQDFMPKAKQAGGSFFASLKRYLNRVTSGNSSEPPSKT